MTVQASSYNSPEQHSERLARKRLRPSDVLVRSAVCELLRQPTGKGTFEGVERVLARRYSSCPATSAYIARTATNPAQTGVVGWAAELVDAAVIDFIENDMQRSSGFAQLASRALTVTLDGFGSVKIPSRSSPLSLMGAWIGESASKPVYAGVLGAATLVPYKLAAVSVFSEEMMLYSQIELLVRESLSHDLSCLLDTTIFDAAAVSAGIRPAGLFNSATSVTASALTPANEAMIADLRGLANAVAGGNPDASIAFVVNPAQALRIGILAPQYQNLIVSGYMPAGSVGAIDVGGIAMIVGQPTFRISTDAVLHMDTAATALSATGSPNTVAAPMASLYQADLVALRCVLRAGWIKRRAAATALVTGAIW